MDKARWHRLLRSLGLSTENATFEKLQAAYSEKHRAYHTVHHIDDCLSQFDLTLDLLDNHAAVEFAIWFHDAIYRPFSKINEEDSADWAVEFLVSNDASEALKAEVSRLILATKHNVPLQSNDESLLVDIDLTILGSEPEVYAQFEDNIRFEYRNVPGIIFRKKRVQLLRGFMDRDHIYGNKHFRDLYESQARSNLQHAVEVLQG